jgi:hypothetical protein
VTRSRCTLAAVDVLTLVLLTLAVARVTRLLVADGLPLMVRARSWVAARGDAWEYLTLCPWCVGAWVALGFTVVVDQVVGLPVPGLVWPAAAYVAAWLVILEPDADEEV